MKKWFIFVWRRISINYAAQSNKRQMAKRISSVCERVTEIKNKRKKINSINKVINNKHKNIDARTQNRTQKLHLAHSQSFTSKCDLSCNPTKTRWHWKHSIGYHHISYHNGNCNREKYLSWNRQQLNVRLGGGNNNNTPGYSIQY